ncbi:Acetylpolyamine amidohydrolase 2 [Exophiala dermatitidis]
MLVTLFDPDTLLHNTVELLGSKLIPALESPKRIKVILEALGISGHEIRTIRAGASCREEPKARLLTLTADTHDYGYLQHLRDVHDEWVAAGLIEKSGHVLPECFFLPTSTGKPMRPLKDPFARAGYYAFDMSSGIMSESYRAMVASANLAVEGTDMLLGFPGNAPGSNPVDTVLALCRPPGHHCDGRRAGGYCYINNAALAVSTWRSAHPEAHIGILDIDFHHGNGTQEIFYADPKVLYTSIHGQDEFPYYTGDEEERGIGEGSGKNFNFPLKVGSSVEEYLRKLELALQFLVDFGPEFLVVSLGFDTYHSDPLGYFQIHTEDYSVIAERIRRRLKDVPALILLEGGYVIEHLGDNMLSFLRGWKSVEL